MPQEQANKNYPIITQGQLMMMLKMDPTIPIPAATIRINLLPLGIRKPVAAAEMMRVTCVRYLMIFTFFAIPSKSKVSGVY
jgi:hypothetical protein